MYNRVVRNIFIDIQIQFLSIRFNSSSLVVARNSVHSTKPLQFCFVVIIVRMQCLCFPSSIMLFRVCS
jgi:hypothetical protein